MPYDVKLKIYYLRLSKEDGDVEAGTAEESFSIGSQRTCIHRYIRSLGMNPDEFEEVVDDGYSGTNMNRPGMQKLLTLVATDRVELVIVRDLSRFSRDYLEAGHYLEFVFPYHDIRFVSINDDYDSYRLGESTGGLELAIKNLVNQMYSRDISRKIKSAVDLKKMNGEYVYGTAPYGYKKGEKKNTIVVDPEVSHIVYDIFAWAASGITITNIAKRLNDAGVPSPSVYLAPVRGKYKTRPFWTFESVRNILDNRIYTGDTVPFKSHVVRVGSDRVKQIPEELRVVIPNTHEAIITQEMFYQARLVIKSNKKKHAQSQRNPFTSMLECACCGNKLTKGKASNKTWMCTTGRYTDTTECKKVRIAETMLTDIVLNAILMQCRVLDEKVAQIRNEHHKMKSSYDILKSEVRNLRMKIGRFEEAKMRLYEDYVDEKITKDEYLAQKSVVSNELDDLKLRLNVSQNQLDEMEERIKTGTKYINNSAGIVRYRKITELTPELMKELVKRIVVRPDGSIKIEWNFTNEIASILNMETLITQKVG